MIDIENDVFAIVAPALRSAFSGINVTSESIATPPSFPCASVVEIDNATNTQTLDSSGTENHANVAYQVEVYSNLTSGKKTQCKAIMAAIDDQMLSMGFLRVSNNPTPIPNGQPGIYRMVARYRATVSKDDILYRR